MVDLSHQGYIPNFMEIGPLVLEKISSEGFFTIYGHGDHFGHVTNNLLINLHFLVPKSLHSKFGKNGPVVSEKSTLSFCFANKKCHLDLKYSHTFIYSISCLYLPTFRSQAEIVSEKSIVFTFSYRTS